MYGHFKGVEAAVGERDLTSKDETALDGGGTARVVEAANHAVLDGFTVRNGGIYEGAGIFANSAQGITVANCLITGNTSPGSGGGIYGINANITITNSTVDKNTANPGSYGGGLYLLNSTSIIDHSTITANAGGTGGGLCVQAGDVKVIATWFQDNHADYSQSGGGAVYNRSCTAAYTNCIFVNNAATYAFGGGMYNDGLRRQ